MKSKDSRLDKVEIDEAVESAFENGEPAYGATTESFGREDEVGYDPEGWKFHKWTYYSGGCAEIIMSSTGHGDGDAGHGGRCSVFFRNLGGFCFNVDSISDEAFTLEVGGHDEVEILRDFFHQAAKALDEISAESKCHEEGLLTKPSLKK